MDRTYEWAVFLIVLTALLFAAPPAIAQVFVYPRRPGQTNTRYFHFDWRYTDILAGDDVQLDRGPAGPRGPADLSDPSEAGTDRSPEGIPRFPLLRPSTPGSSTSPAPSMAARDGNRTTQSEQSDATSRQTSDDNEAAREARLQSLKDEAGGMRLYFYESEREIAGRAATAIESAYTELLESFDYAPPKTFPFILYNTYQEFLQTNLFPIQEGVLGVTSPRSLKLTLPYFGDHQQFRRVAQHELVHQFTIQKLRTVANNKDTYSNPIEAIPLWFIEGLAEHYTYGELDPETRMLVRDLVVHPAPRRGYAMQDFFTQGPGSYLWIYKVGQARVAFLEDTYGEGILQKILEESFRLGYGRWKKGHVQSFEGLVQRVTGDSPENITAKFKNWVKRDAYPGYLEASQSESDFARFRNPDRYIQAMDASPGGHIVAYRSIKPTTGQNRLVLVDHRDESSREVVAVDGRPGLESLHPLANRNFDVRDDRVAFVGRAAGYDKIYVQPFEHSTSPPDNRTRPATIPPASRSEADGDQSDADGVASSSERDVGRARDASFDLGKRRTYDLEEVDLLAAEAPSVEPNGDRIAFIGLNSDGFKDIYILTPDGSDFTIDRVTETKAAERGLAWGENGLIFGSAETGHGKYNLFRIDPEDGADSRIRLTSEPTDHFDPEVADGRVVFTSYDDARANIHTVSDNGTVRETDVATGLFNPAPAPKGGIWSLHHFSGRRIPSRIPASELKSFERRSAAPDVPGRDVSPTDLPSGNKYNAASIQNWELNQGMGVLGFTGDGFYGQLFASASDRLRNHVLTLDFIALGDFERTDGALTYINQNNRLIWGASLFQDFQLRIDETFANPELQNFISYERFYGGRGLLRYPFNRFSYLQFALAAGGVSYFLPDGPRNYLQDESASDASLVDQWQTANDSPRPQVEAEVSLGYDTIQYQRQTGPLSGESLLLSATGDYQPFQGETFGRVRLDAEKYVPIYDRINLFFRLGAGSSFGGRLARQYFLASYYTLRGVPFGQPSYLLGRNFAFTTAEVQFPLNFLVRVPFLDIEGIVGADFGGVGASYPGAWDNRVLDAVAGVNFGLGPVVFRVHFAKPFDIGAPVPNNGDVVPNLSLGWRYL